MYWKFPIKIYWYKRLRIGKIRRFQ